MKQWQFKLPLFDISTKAAHPLIIDTLTGMLVGEGRGSAVADCEALEVAMLDETGE
ncbi:hypothetical protein KIY13_16580 [Pseudomonas lundensis]|jgi:hypothetical protein|uniref:hypothetical protein n=1 Tax=Pseudomonas lundensis TaxID=86185 RepID=UPI001BD31FBA|nr:hypothetical protein [Pseudomonas lundensis]QVQ76277.1 hypothetical protein KIN24_14905 [Pseudomonas lundensis]QVQ80729.1 hypothetical protein KIY13_16580 [Pseudomonas lundensis]